MSLETSASAARLLGLPKQTSLEQVIASIRGGLNPDAVARLARELGLAEGSMLDALAIARRTVQRRRAANKSLAHGDSDRLFRAARALALARETFGDSDKANRWLQKPNRALHGETPLSMLDTEVGEERVVELLHRIDHGLFS